MPDLDKIKELLELLVDKQASAWLLQVIGWAIALWLIAQAIIKVKEVVVKEFWPLLYNETEQRRSKFRRLFASHIASEIDRLNRQEAWSDYRFTELEAEVEAEGRWKVFSIFPFLPRTRSETRRIRSLSKALQISEERRILLEGDPGSGKSVALRFLAKQIAQRATRSRSTKSLIPIYINLKELERQEEEPINRSLIEKFVIKILKRINDGDIEAFVEEEFTRGLREGTWLFLFDSFDEIPDVLSSTESDDVIKAYSGAISDFLHGMNVCRGVIASR
jgi:predicted NACHT family NTPase